MADPLKISPLSRFGDTDRAYDDAQQEWNAGVSRLDTLTAAYGREYYLSQRIETVLQPTVDWMTDSDSFPRQPAPPPTEYVPDPDYLHTEDPLNYNYHPRDLAEAVSGEHAAQIRSEIDTERAALQTIGANNWGTAGMVLGAVFNPHVPLSIAVAPISIPGAALLEMGLETGSEIALHQQQRLRTIEESVWIVGLTGAGVLVLGGAIRGFVGKPVTKAQDAIDELLDDTFDATTAATPKPGTTNLDSVGGQRVRPDPETLTREDDALVGGYLANRLSIGQVAALTQSPFQTARDIIHKFADNPLFTKADAQGKTRGVTIEAVSEAAMGRVVIATEAAGVMQKTSGMSRKEFGQEVGKAMSDGDAHVNPQVQKAAELYRADVIDPIRKAAEKLGLMQSDEALTAKVVEMGDEIKRLVDEGAGPGSVQALRDLDVARAKIVTAQNKKTVELQKVVTKLAKQLETARKPLKGKTEARVAKPEMIKRHNDAKSKLTAHKKAAEDLTKENRAKATAIKKQKQYLSKVRKEQREAQAKLDNGLMGALSYFPRIYNKQQIYKNWAGLENLLTRKFREKMGGKYEEGEIMEAVQETMMNMVAGRGVAIGTGKVPSALRARVLDVLDSELETFLEKDAAAAMIKHTQGMTPYLLMRETFGDQTLADLSKLIDEEHARMLSKGKVASVQPSADPYAALPDNIPYTPKEMQKLADQAKDAKTRLKVVYDRLMHQVQRSIRTPGAVERVLQASKLWNLTTMLGGVVLSSLPDLARSISHYGMRSFVKGAAHGMNQWMGGAGNVASIQVKRLGAALQRTLNQRAMDLSDSLEPESKLALRTQKAWSTLSGFDVYTDIMESVAAHAAMDWTLRQAQALTAGKTLSKSATRQLTRMGLNADDIKALWKESEGTMGAQDTTLKYMNTMQWKDVDLARRVEAAIGSDVRRTIIRIGAGEKPAAMDDHWTSWMFQFQSFAMSAQNKIMVAGFQNVSKNQAEGLVAMMFLGMGVGATKAYLRGDDPTKWSVEQWAFEGIDRSGMIGALRTPFNMLRYAGAAMGVTDGVPSRYVGREWESMITAPAASVLGHANRAAVAMFEGDHASAADHVLKATPFVNNTWHIREVLQNLGDQ